jgi:NADH:quinone reductase (non-electrogenic)
MYNGAIMSHRIVIVGAGFVGLPAACRIKSTLRDSADVILVDQKDHFLFAPRLIDALAGDVEQDQIKTDLPLIADRFDFRFIQARVDTVDRKKQRVFYTLPASGGTTSSLSYDYLVLCEGAKTSYFNIPGSEEFTRSLKSLNDVYAIHARVHGLVERARHLTTPEQKSETLSFVVVGGGASGVETLMALKRYAERHCEEHAPRLKRFLSFSLMEAGPQILNGFPLNIVHGAMKEMERQNITLNIGEAVSCVENTCVTIAEKKRMPAGLTIWAAGISPNIIQMIPEVHRDPRGNLITDAFLRIEPRIFAAGDVVTVQEKNVTVPKNAQTAMRMSKTISENVLRAVRHKPPIRFQYSSIGSVLWLGRKGYINLKFFSIKTRLAVIIREVFYRYRHWQITRG